jgi:hypothetical protein
MTEQPTEDAWLDRIRACSDGSALRASVRRPPSR